MRTRLLLLALAVLVLPSAAQAQQQCSLRQLASLNMELDSTGRIMVPMTVQGRQMRMLIDTAGIFMHLDENAVRALGLKPQKFTGMLMAFYGSSDYSNNYYVRVDGTRLANLVGGRADFLVMENDTSGFDGILGPNYFANFDLEFDFAGGKLNLFSQDHCEGKVVYWANSYARIPVTVDEVWHLKATAELDGKPIDIIIDTGASNSVMRLERASSIFGLKPDSPGMEQADPDETADASYRYHFKTLKLGDIEIRDPSITLVPDKVSAQRTGSEELILGISILRQLRIYLAYKEHALYVTSATAHR